MTTETTTVKKIRVSTETAEARELLNQLIAQYPGSVVSHGSYVWTVGPDASYVRVRRSSDPNTVWIVGVKSVGVEGAAADLVPARFINKR